MVPGRRCRRVLVGYDRTVKLTRRPLERVLLVAAPVLLGVWFGLLFVNLFAAQCVMLAAFACVLGGRAMERRRTRPQREARLARARAYADAHPAQPR